MTIFSKEVNDKLTIGLDGDKQVYAVELGPMLVKKKMTTEVLDNNVTASHYQQGKPDALGVPINVDQVSTIVDWKQKFSKKQWKYYVIGDRVNEDGSITENVMILHGSEDSKKKAITAAEKHYKEHGYATHS